MSTHEQGLRLRRHPAEAARARQQVAQFCAAMTSDVRSTAQLLTSELVTNAIEHGTGEISLWLSASDHTMRVEVADESPQGPQLNPASTEELSGRGLVIIESLASAWGVTPAALGRGKVVWFALRTLP